MYQEKQRLYILQVLSHFIFKILWGRNHKQWNWYSKGVSLALKCIVLMHVWLILNQSHFWIWKHLKQNYHPWLIFIKVTIFLIDFSRPLHNFVIHKGYYLKCHDLILSHFYFWYHYFASLYLKELRYCQFYLPFYFRYVKISLCSNLFYLIVAFTY